MYKLKSVFIPNVALQGTELPMHVLWDSDKPLWIQVFYPPDVLEPREVYNVKESGLEIGPGYILAKDFETDGYLGMVFDSKILDDPDKEISIKIVLGESKNVFSVIERPVLLFRPLLVVTSMPKEIAIIQRKEGKISLNDYIGIKNIGKGTAILAIVPSEESEVKIAPPENLQEYIEQFFSILIRKLNELRTEFPQYSDLVGKFIEFIRSPMEKLADTENEVEEIIENLKHICETDRDFLEAFAEAFASAYFGSIYLITDIHTLLEYLNSIVANRILLLNAMSVFEIMPGNRVFKGTLVTTDVTFNKHETVNIEIIFNSKVDSVVKLPVYQIFKVDNLRNDLEGCEDDPIK